MHDYVQCTCTGMVIVKLQSWKNTSTYVPNCIVHVHVYTCTAHVHCCKLVVNNHKAFND